MTTFWILSGFLTLAVIPQAAYGQVQMQETYSYGGWPNCVRLTNGQIELIITTDVGPRVIRLGFVGGQNLFKEFADDLGKAGGSEWRSYGGHRLWHAPEAIPRSYFPDNFPVTYKWNGNSLRLTQPIETTTGIVKELEITLEPKENHVTVAHRLINRGLWEIELAPWALSVMAPGGRAIIPQEPYRPHPEYVLPARPMVMWAYTDMSDPRWIWGTKYIQLRQDPKATTKQKVGLGNTLGWAAYYLRGELFLKRFGYDPNASYPDWGCNTEMFTDANFLEVETLGKLTKLLPGEHADHTEHWFLQRVLLDESEASLDQNLLPVVRRTDMYKPKE